MDTIGGLDTLTAEQAATTAYMAAGAASGVFLRADPNLIMPSQEISDAVATCLSMLTRHDIVGDR